MRSLLFIPAVFVMEINVVFTATLSSTFTAVLYWMLQDYSQRVWVHKYFESGNLKWRHWLNLYLERLEKNYGSPQSCCRHPCIKKHVKHNCNFCHKYTTPFQRHALLGAFTNLRKATLSIIMSVCPSVCLFAWNNSVSTGRIFIKIIFELFFKNLLRKFKFR